MNLQPYKLFSPPDDLASKSPKEWTSREATSYFNWMLDGVNERVTDLINYVDESPVQSHGQLLKRVGGKLETVLQREPFVNETPVGRRLSSAGFAIAADAGLLLAKCLIDGSSSRISWDILRKPKNAQSFNLPVLVGFISGVELDPVAASIAQATGVLRGIKKDDRWLKIYEFWMAQVDK